MLYPGERHGIRGQPRGLHLWRTYSTSSPALRPGALAPNHSSGSAAVASSGRCSVGSTEIIDCHGSRDSRR
jgi:hypothetical protein